MGATTVYVTHDQLEAMQMGDKIVVMNHGVIEQFGEPQDIYDKPATLLRRGLHRVAVDELSGLPGTGRASAPRASTLNRQALGHADDAARRSVGDARLRRAPRAYSVFRRWRLTAERSSRLSISARRRSSAFTTPNGEVKARIPVRISPRATGETVGLEFNGATTVTLFDKPEPGGRFAHRTQRGRFSAMAEVTFRNVVKGASATRPPWMT